MERYVLPDDFLWHSNRKSSLQSAQLPPSGVAFRRFRFIGVSERQLCSRSCGYRCPARNGGILPILLRTVLYRAFGCVFFRRLISPSLDASRTKRRRLC